MKEIQNQEELFIKFANYELSSAFFKIFLLVIKGDNYPTVISKKLKKHKTIIARQLRMLEKFNFIVAKGSGPKLRYEPNWKTFLIYWIDKMEINLDLISWNAKTSLTKRKKIRYEDVFTVSSVELEKLKVLRKNINNIYKKAIDSLPYFQQIFELYFNSVPDNVKNFFEAFMGITQSLWVAESQLIDFTKPHFKRVVNNSETKKFLEFLAYDLEVLLKVTTLSFNTYESFNTIRNYLADTAQL